MTEMFGEAWPPMSVPDLAPDDDDEVKKGIEQNSEDGVKSAHNPTPRQLPDTVFVISPLRCCPYR